MKYLCPVLFLIFSSTCSATLWSQEAPENMDFDPSFSHVVYFWLHNPEDSLDRTQFETALSKLFRNSQYTKTNFLGTPPKATREVVDGSFTYAMIVTFESAEAQAAYQKEPAHLEFIEEAGHLLKDYVVYDAVGLKP
jgi:hypothetical protein